MPLFVLRMIFLHSHRWAYHQEDILVLLANLRLGDSVSVQADGGVDRTDHAVYCNLNRVMWGHREVDK